MARRIHHLFNTDGTINGPGFVCLEFDTLLITAVSWWYHTQEQIRVYAEKLIQIHCFFCIGLYTF